MSLLFEPLQIGSLHLRNRLMRSATAERLSHPDTGAPLPALAALYRALGEGGVGTIVTGHAFVEPAGKAHPEMSSLASDDLIPAWRQTIAAAQAAGAQVIVQINHSGASCDPDVNPDPVSPSGVATAERARPRAMTGAEVERAIEAFSRAAWRAQQAGFDGVQLHGAHGYLITQFLTPATNSRSDRWGPGGPYGRLGFLRDVVDSVRRQVGDRYPVWIKLGVSGASQHGLTAADGARVAAFCREVGIACVEVSHALGQPEEVGRGEGRYLPLAEAARAAVGPGYPLALVNGLRSLRAMERILAGGVVRLASMCRPLIAEPDLPKRLASGASRRAVCASCGNCWAEGPGLGTGCHNEKVREKLLDRTS
jgi:2,4-dienoyl-CoA reductase-like NADH-dependent reductase (Old Yellow Enzyme family)